MVAWCNQSLGVQIGPFRHLGSEAVLRSKTGSGFEISSLFGLAGVLEDTIRFEHNCSLYCRKSNVIKAYSPFKFQWLCHAFHSLFISVCGHYTHTHTHAHPDTSHAVPTAACQSMKSHYPVMGMCEISRRTGGGQRHARGNQCKRDSSLSCA